jgi:hypothetical protein
LKEGLLIFNEMQKEEISKEFINTVIEYTRTGRIRWKRQSLSTLYFEQFTKNNEKAIMSIQRVSWYSFVDYIFIVKNLIKNEVNLNIETSKEKLYWDQLNELYTSALSSIENDNANFLSDLIDSIN